MSTTELAHLFVVDAPFISVGVGEPERHRWNPGHFYSTSGMRVCVRRTRGQKMRTVQGLMDEFAAALQFFDGFGENWAALGECLSYLDEWLPAEAYVLVVERAEELLAEEPSDLPAFLRSVQRAAESWSKPITDNDRFNRPAVPFHLLLNLSTPSDEATQRFVDAATSVEVPLRLGSR